MDNNNNELFNGIIDVPTEPQTPNTNNNQNLEYNFNFETQIEPTQNMVESQQMPSQTNIPNQTEVLGMEFQTPQNNVETIQMPTENVAQITAEEQKVVDEEKLKSLSADTNELVNPNLIVNPALKPIGMQTETKGQVNDVQQEEGGKGKYLVAILIIALIVIFICLLPRLTGLFGF